MMLMGRCGQNVDNSVILEPRLSNSELLISWKLWWISVRCSILRFKYSCNNDDVYNFRVFKVVSPRSCFVFVTFVSTVVSKTLVVMNKGWVNMNKGGKNTYLSFWKGSFSVPPKHGVTLDHQVKTYVPDGINYILLCQFYKNVLPTAPSRLAAAQITYYVRGVRGCAPDNGVNPHRK